MSMSALIGTHRKDEVGKGECCKPQKKQDKMVISEPEKCQEDETSQGGANLCAQDFSHLCVVGFFFPVKL